MTQSQQRVRAASVCYAMLCVSWLARPLILAQIDWKGSWEGLFALLAMLPAGFWAIVLGQALVNGAMSVLSFNFLALHRALRAATICIAVLLVLCYAASLVAHLKHPFEPQCCASQPLAWTATVGLVVGYSMCAYLLWSAAWTSNNRSRGP